MQSLIVGSSASHHGTSALNSASSRAPPFSLYERNKAPRDRRRGLLGLSRAHERIYRRASRCARRADCTPYRRPSGVRRRALGFRTFLRSRGCHIKRFYCPLLTSEAKPKFKRLVNRPRASKQHFLARCDDAFESNLVRRDRVPTFRRTTAPRKAQPCEAQSQHDPSRGFRYRVADGQVKTEAAGAALSRRHRLVEFVVAR
jgi:hypothetical protein